MEIKCIYLIESPLLTNFQFQALHEDDFLLVIKISEEAIPKKEELALSILQKNKKALVLDAVKEYDFENLEGYALFLGKSLQNFSKDAHLVLLKNNQLKKHLSPFVKDFRTFQAAKTIELARKAIVKATNEKEAQENAKQNSKSETAKEDKTDVPKNAQQENEIDAVKRARKRQDERAEKKAEEEKNKAEQKKVEPKQPTTQKNMKEDDPSFSKIEEMSLPELERYLFREIKNEVFVDEMSEREKKKADLVDCLFNRLKESYGVYIKNYLKIQNSISESDYLTLTLMILQSEDKDEFDTNWGVLGSKKITMMFTEKSFLQIKEEAGFYHETCDFLYKKDKWN